VIFFGSIALVPRLGTNFFDNSNQNTFSITQVLPVSSSLQQTNQATQQVEAVLANVPGIQTYQVTIGSSGSVASSFSGGSGSNSASYAVTTDANADQVALQQTVHDRLHALTGVGTITLSASNQGFNNSNLAVNVQIGTPADSVQGMQNLLIPSPTGNIKLGEVATVTQINGPTQITHLGGVRTATVNATVTSSNVGAVSSDMQQRINKLSLPNGATVSLGGVISSQSQAFQGLLLAQVIAIMLVYMIMVVTFRSIIQPLILLVSIPFAVTGSILLMLMTHTTLGVPALIGLLMLVGIVVTNAIVLLDLVNQYRAKGLDARNAVIEGGRRRLRPILMTAIATILALVPMALGLSKAGGFIAGPLAIVVIGGLTTSTILTLLLVPTLYVIVEDIRGRFSRGKTTPPAPPSSAKDLESQDTQELTALA
jgi:hydrophobic/amphiphilic exporter-1 (mainly G- bacteria), HAE1 family